MKFTDKELTSAAEYLWHLLLSGKTDEEATDELGVDPDDYNRIKLRAFDLKAQELRRAPVEHVYAQYILDQTRNIKELTNMLGEFRSSRQHNAFVGGIRLRADLYDRILTKGQECGLIHKSPEQRQIVAGVVVADLSNKQIQAMIKKELEVATTMMEKFGESPFMDLDPGDVHYGPALPPARSAEEDATDADGEPAVRPSKKAKKRKKQRLAIR
jgi:hypothetical protein